MNEVIDIIKQKGSEFIHGGIIDMIDTLIINETKEEYRENQFEEVEQYLPSLDSSYWISNALFMQITNNRENLNFAFRHFKSGTISNLSLPVVCEQLFKPEYDFPAPVVEYKHALTHALVSWLDYIYGQKGQNGSDYETFLNFCKKDCMKDIMSARGAFANCSLSSSDVHHLNEMQRKASETHEFDETMDEMSNLLTQSFKSFLDNITPINQAA